MQAAWIVLGGLISIISGFVAWQLNSRTSRDIQERQQNHELAMQRERLEIERQNEQDEAVRAARRVRLQPVFDLIADVENGYTHCFWKVLIEHAEKDDVFDATISDLAAELFPDGIPFDLRARVVQDIVEIVPRPSPEILARAGTVVSRIGDEALRRDVSLLVAGLFLPIPDFRARFLKIAEAHRRLEQYAATV